MTISTGSVVHESSRQRAVVSDRGAAFGDIYLVGEADETEVRFCWTGDGQIWVHGAYSSPTRSQKNRAVRALAETEMGRKALGLPETYDPDSVPSAAEEEHAELVERARRAGILPEPSPVEVEPTPAPVPPSTSTVVTSVDGVRVEVNVTVERQ